MKSIQLIGDEAIFINGMPYVARKEGATYVMIPLDDMTKE